MTVSFVSASVQDTNNGFLNLNHKDSNGDSALSLALCMDLQHLVPDLIAGTWEGNAFTECLTVELGQAEAKCIHVKSNIEANSEVSDSNCLVGQFSLTFDSRQFGRVY